MVELGSARRDQAEYRDQLPEGKGIESKLHQRNTDPRQSGDNGDECAGADLERNPIYDTPQYPGSPTVSASSSRTLSSDRNWDRQCTTAEAATAEISPLPAVTHSETVPPALRTTIICPVCSMSNGRLNPTCTACAHVLDPKKAPRHWRCGSEVCQGSQYVNAGDCGVCGACGTRRNT